MDFEEAESTFGPADLDPSLPFLEAYFASSHGREPAPIRNYHTEPPVSETTKRNATPAAVLVPIVQHPSELRVLLTRRHEDISYPGQVCFPGGRADAGDRDATATALREAQEEIDLEPDRVRVLGRLGQYFTQTGFNITPIVGIVTPPLSLTPSPSEVVEILEIPLSVLPRANSYRIWRREASGERAYYALEHGEVRVTGPTVCLAMGFFEALAETQQTLSPSR